MGDVYTGDINVPKPERMISSDIIALSFPGLDLFAYQQLSSTQNPGWLVQYGWLYHPVIVGNKPV